MMDIAGLVKTTTIDFPGRLACAVFVPGCNYQCWFCHNHGLLGAPPLLDFSEVMAFLEKRAGLLEGIVISGGEPTLQSDLLDFMRCVKGMGYAVKLDTNGSRPDVLAAVLAEGLADYVAVDYKAPLEAYRSVCGVDAGGVLETIAQLLQAPPAVLWEMRTTVLPDFAPETLEAMARAAPQLPAWYLQPYRPAHDGAPACRHSTAQLLNYAEALAVFQPNVRVRA